MESLSEVEGYLLRREYPSGFTKSEKSNLRRKCKKNFRIENGVLQYKVSKEKGEDGEWRVCVRTLEEKRRILECCHGGMEGILFIPLA